MPAKSPCPYGTMVRGLLPDWHPAGRSSRAGCGPGLPDLAVWAMMQHLGVPGPVQCLGASPGGRSGARDGTTPGMLPELPGGPVRP